MPYDPRMVEIVEARAPQARLAPRKSGRLDDMNPNAEARPEPQDGADVGGNIRLVKSDVGHGFPSFAGSTRESSFQGIPRWPGQSRSCRFLYFTATLDG